MKTNHSRGFKARQDHHLGYKFHAGFKRDARAVLRNVERKALRSLVVGHLDSDEVVFPSKPSHGEDSWYHD